MEIRILKPRKALNKAFLKVKPIRTEIEKFKSELVLLLNRIDSHESEEFHKNLISDFLKKSYFEPDHFINTKGRYDLVIHNGNSSGTSVGVIIEAKSPVNRTEMPKYTDKEAVINKEANEIFNVKSFQELILYYLRERVVNKNLELKQLIITNIYEWYVFDANIFEKLIVHDKNLIKQFNEFESGRLSGKTTDFFYNEIAAPFISKLEQFPECTYFNIRDYEKALRNADKKDDNQLIALFKLLSPEHLLKLPFTNDSNSLDKRFYGELLHIIGLTETKEGSKKLIGRSKEKDRNTGSLLENAIVQLDSLDKISRLENQRQYGANHQERLFNISLELSITWINRILFLKLLEAQLISYHKGDRSYEFLNYKRIQDYDSLNKLFFQVLAKQHSERSDSINKNFDTVPYLNSSLFEPSDIEHQTIFIGNLEDEYKIPIHSSTVLKDGKGNKLTGEMNTLQYLFEFLNAYDFASEGSEVIQEDNKTLINASVLGLIFEKINGYKDGSFFTPGFITMYMCRETIRRAVVQKFNESKGWNCNDLTEIYNRIDDIKEANDIVNSLKICDPAVGSGHFLVSALNEIIAVKNDLNILKDKEHRRLRNYQVEVVNDELVVTDEEGDLFEYNPANKESQRIQETLFHEKQTIIENCLFGVDINPNSVKICRLRLWIELLKNAYYKSPDELETLPNIDINIKCGNSLISRFPLDADLSKSLKSKNYTIDSYRLAVDSYRNAHSKEQKRSMERLITDIKSDFRSEISRNDQMMEKYRKLSGELMMLTSQPKLFEQTEKEKTDWDNKVKKLGVELSKIEAEIEEIKNNRIYENAFEWRFEFPEVLDDEGNFVGFDVVIANPPYVNFANLPDDERLFYKKFDLYKNKTDLYAFFVGLANKIKNSFGYVCLIIPHTWISTSSFYPLRKLLLDGLNLFKIVELEFGIFKDAYVKTVIIQTTIEKPDVIELHAKNFKLEMKVPIDTILFDNELKINLSWNPVKHSIFQKIKNNSIQLGKIIHFSRGIKTSNDKRFLFTENKGKEFYRVLRGRNIKAYTIEYENEYIWYRPDLMKEKVGCLPHTEELFLVPKKIITQRINSSGQLLVTLDTEQYFCLDTTNISSEIIDNSYELEFIVALMNSKLINWWFNDEFKNPTISGYELHQIPVRRNTKIETNISDLVKIVLKTNGISKNEFIDIIDRLVFQLYDLTPDEIAIVEGGK